jgi:hypothetical protein
MKHVLPAAILLVSLIVNACQDDGTEATSTTIGVSFETGIGGTLEGVPEDDWPAPQVLVWATDGTGTVATGGLQPQPTAAAIVVDSRFGIPLEPGAYLIRVTEYGGHVCGEESVEVNAGDVTRIEFSCS